jgi:glycosyltransferase involved in cell wall biosynthesis
VLKAAGWWELERGIFSERQKRRLDMRLCLAVLRHAGAWIAVNPELREAMLLAGVAPGRVHLVPNGVDTDRLCPGPSAGVRDRLRFSRDGPHVLFIGRLVKEKDLTTLLRAWRVVLQAQPLAHLHIVGNGPLRAALEAEGRQLGIAERVIFHGEQTDVLSYLRAADCFVLPSTIEGMSNALLEAMAVALPIVATRIPGTEAVIEHGRSGVLVPVADAAALAQAIAALLGDPAQATALGAAARARVHTNFGIERIADVYQRLYREGHAARDSSRLKVAGESAATDT